jgi:hypothetical protein
MTTLVAAVAVGDKELRVSGPMSGLPGMVKVDDELFDVGGSDYRHGRTLALRYPATEAHESGATVTRVLDAFTVDDNSPFTAAGSFDGDASAIPVASPLTGTVQSNLETALEGGGGNPTPTLADLGLDTPPMWAAETSFMATKVMSGSYGPAFYQLDGWVLGAEDYVGSGYLTGAEAPDLTGLGVGDGVTDGGYTMVIMAAIGDWPPTPATWQTGQPYDLSTAWVWPTEPDGSLWGPDPNLAPDGTPSTTEPPFGGSGAANYYAVTDPASSGVYIRWGAAHGAFGGAMPAVRGANVELGVSGDGATEVNAFLLASGVDATATAQTWATTTGSGEARGGSVIASYGSGPATVNHTASAVGAGPAQAGIEAVVAGGSGAEAFIYATANGGADQLGFRIRPGIIDLLGFADLPTADPHVAGRIWLDSGVLTVSSG